MLDTSEDGGRAFMGKLQEFLLNRNAHTKRLVRFAPSTNDDKGADDDTNTSQQLILQLDTKIAGMFKVSWEFKLDGLQEATGRLDRDLWIEPLLSVCLHRESTVDRLVKELQRKDQLIQDLRTKLELLQPRGTYSGNSPRKNEPAAFNVESFSLEDLVVWPGVLSIEIQDLYYFFAKEYKKLVANIDASGIDKFLESERLQQLYQSYPIAVADIFPLPKPPVLQSTESLVSGAGLKGATSPRAIQPTGALQATADDGSASPLISLSPRAEPSPLFIDDNSLKMTRKTTTESTDSSSQPNTVVQSTAERTSTESAELTAPGGGGGEPSLLPATQSTNTAGESTINSSHSLQVFETKPTQKKQKKRRLV